MYLTEAVIKSAGGSCCRKLNCNSSPRFVRSRSYFPTTSARAPVMGKRFYPCRGPCFVICIRAIDPYRHRPESIESKFRRSCNPRSHVHFQLLHAQNRENICWARPHSRARPLEEENERGGEERESRTESEWNTFLNPQWKYYVTRPLRARQTRKNFLRLHLRNVCASAVSLPAPRRYSHV